MIWSVDQGQIFYLDGQTFARPGLRVDGQTARADLILPSGAGVRASEFESWLFVRAVVDFQPELTSFTVTPAVVRAGERVTWTVTLSGAAPSSGETVTLTETVLSGKDPVLDFPTTLSVPAGKTTASLPSLTQINTAGSVFVKASLRGVEQHATLTTQVVLVKIDPPAPSLFPNFTRQFRAIVEGADDVSATFAILEKSAGGSIAKTGKTTANYTAPSALGDYHVEARSVADPSKFATATVTVIEKTIDSKANKDIKDVRDGIDKDFPDRPGTDLPDRRRRQGASVAQRRRAVGQAFIRPEERPLVGEPKGGAKKKGARPSRKKRKP
jgi:hypothetical protein